MKDWKVVEIFTYKKRLCVIVQMQGYASIDKYCTGYVQTNTKNCGKHYDLFIDKINADELTYSGGLAHFKDERIPDTLWFLGFDSAHSWNDDNPESKTVASVKERTIKMADEMVEANI